MTFFNMPETQYSIDGGKTWRADGPMIGPGVLIRIIEPNGTVIYTAHAETKKIECDCCDGSGVRTLYHYVKDNWKGGA
jgi:hypothetical protein